MATGFKIPKLPPPPHIRTMRQAHPVLPRGEKLFNQPLVYLGGPGAPPPGFTTGQQSGPEWIVYWALSKIFGLPRDPRLPPFNGGYPIWGYQVPMLGVYTRQPGSSVPDFVVWTARVILRVNGNHYHEVTTATKQAYDMMQKAELERVGFAVMDLWEENLVGDPTGEKAVINVKRAVGQLEPIDPIISATGRRLR